MYDSKFGSKGYQNRQSILNMKRSVRTCHIDNVSYVT